MFSLTGVRQQLSDQKEAHVAAEDYVQAEQVKADMEALATRKTELSQSLQPKVVEQARQLNPAEVQLACLTILNASLVATPATPSPLGAGSQVQNLVLPGFQTADAAIRNLAVSCLGLYCLGNLGFAQDHVLLLLQVAQVRRACFARLVTLLT